MRKYNTATIGGAKEARWRSTKAAQSKHGNEVVGPEQRTTGVSLAHETNAHENTFGTSLCDSDGIITPESAEADGRSGKAGCEARRK